MIDPTLKPSAAGVLLAVFDVDGVLTDGQLLFDEQGEALKAFNALDGQGIRMLQRAGVKTAIITGRNSMFVERRASDLGIDYLLQGREDKLVALREILAVEKIELSSVAYLGDDLPDLPAIRAVGFGCAVATAHEFVIEHTPAVTHRPGGRGAAREFCDFILSARGDLQRMQQAYLESV